MNTTLEPTVNSKLSSMFVYMCESGNISFLPEQTISSNCHSCIELNCVYEMQNSS